ncbi:kynureninase [Lophiostoma macrostomum CBS 122681]|uniref:Kynureninase n=1 Tax=Lophiostoma macrostomum CBS 122681 TaxID=1314788 RepID=A0A6A6TAA2_9PLEO|nr:kynureninase [Lophiostoma macrostomum CBS 122681]
MSIGVPEESVRAGSGDGERRRAGFEVRRRADGARKSRYIDCCCGDGAVVRYAREVVRRRFGGVGLDAILLVRRARRQEAHMLDEDAISGGIALCTLQCWSGNGLMMQDAARHRRPPTFIQQTPKRACHLGPPLPPGQPSSSLSPPAVRTGSRAMPKLERLFQRIGSEELCSEEFARKEDERDALRDLRSEFVIPTKGDLGNKRYGPARTNRTDVSNEQTASDDSEESIYLCGNSLGLQPRRTRDYINKYLDTWASKGVFGHFKELEDGHAPWLHIDDAVKGPTAKIVGALPSEVVIMETLTANLHLLMASFYRPTKDRYKIIIEGKAFPSDHYAALSQLAHHDLPPSALITIDPPSPSSPYLSNEHILSTISQHAASTALVLLPGIQFYSGQFLDIELITHHCHLLGITVGWDLAHAVGNVPLKLHDWNVDFAAWCNYKYMNGGPGVIGGLFVHERHGKVRPTALPQDSEAVHINGASSGTSSNSTSTSTNPEPHYRPRLSGWWGSDKRSRFRMENVFVPIPGASGFQLSNPSALDMTAVQASLDVFELTSMDALRAKSLRITAYLEERLLRWSDTDGDADANAGGVPKPPYTLITPPNPAERGAQISVLLHHDMLDFVLEFIEARGVVVDERKPDVLRVAPAPLYNSFGDVHRFVGIFQEACRRALEKGTGKGEGRIEE